MASLLSNAAMQSSGLFHRGVRRHLVLSLPRWATDCLRRAEPQLNRPLALWEKQNGAMRVVAVDALAAGRGLSAGQTLSDAKAQVPDLEPREIDRSQVEHLFSQFADWHSNASPLVAVLTDHAPYGDLCLDITGVSHLFGGEAPMLETLTGRLRRRGFTVGGAVADTVGAAWALAHFDPGRIVAADLPDAIAPLPVAALRLEEAQIAALSQVGLRRIGQLYGRDRKGLQARFGLSLVTRLDQALGQIEERITPRLPVTEHFAERRFSDPIGLIDDVLMCAQDLAVQLGLRLERHQLGAQTFHLLLYLVDHKVIGLSVNASRATRDPGHIARLFRHRAERLAGEYDPGFGIDMIRLGASSITEVPSSQAGAFGMIDGTEDLERLFDRMTSRLGPLAIVRSKLVDSHIPERAVRLDPSVASQPNRPEAQALRLARPLRLLPAPEPVAVVAEVPDGPPASMIWRRVRYRFVKASGPERIEAEWWRSGKRLMLAASAGRDEEAANRDGRPQAEPAPYVPPLGVFIPEAELRDYYIAEDEAGRRFWVFRQGLYGGDTASRWYLHGFFS